VRRQAVTKLIERRKFLRHGSAIGAASFLGLRHQLALAEPPPETTRIRLSAVPVICIAPQYVAGPLLNAEGFTDIEYVKVDRTGDNVAAGVTDLDLLAVGNLITDLDGGAKLTALAGVHLGCYELFGREPVRAIRDLKGKTVPIDGIGGPQHIFLSAMAAYVGLDPRKDINWVTSPSAEGMQLFVDGKADAFLGFPPQPQELRARKAGHVVVNTAIDKPWSEYYCCMLIGNREFVERNPVATKRAMRAILKAADLCALQPERAARMIVQKGFTSNYSYALETLKEVRYNAWRSYDPEDAIRFHSLRLHEVGMIKSTPQKIISQGTDWRFLNEIKKELKA
jgi:NitT/TauT family transport system substrate-binding protein